MSMQLSDLKDAGYNPRVISDKRLANLSKSMALYGDLSGVVFNDKTKTLISGHQRLRTLREAKAKTKIVLTKSKDDRGTIKVGHIEASLDGTTIRIPLRVVSWSDKKAEMAANIAANAHGGDFDKAKLGTLLAKLQKGKQFDVDVLGLDPLSIRGLLANVNLPAIGDSGPETDARGEFPAYDENSFDFNQCCPKCGFQFSAKAGKKALDDASGDKKAKHDKAKKVKSKKAEASSRHVKSKTKTDAGKKRRGKIEKTNSKKAKK